MPEHAWSYTSGTSELPLLGLTIGDLFDQISSRYGDNEALVSRHQGLRYTYRQLRIEVDRCARALMGLGVEKGQRIGIWAPNCAEWAITQFATSKLGAILVNINPSYRLSEVQYALRQSGCTWLVIAPEFKTSDYTGHDPRAGARAGPEPAGEPRRRPGSPICARWSGSARRPRPGCSPGAVSWPWPRR